jgi:hypothetical protein
MLLQATIGFSSDQVEMSSNGTVLAAMSDLSNAQFGIEPSSIQIYSLPAATLTSGCDYSAAALASFASKDANALTLASVAAPS